MGLLGAVLSVISSGGRGFLADLENRPKRAVFYIGMIGVSFTRSSLRIVWGHEVLYPTCLYPNVSRGCYRCEGSNPFAANGDGRPSRRSMLCHYSGSSGSIEGMFIFRAQ